MVRRIGIHGLVVVALAALALSPLSHVHPGTDHEDATIHAHFDRHAHDAAGSTSVGSGGDPHEASFLDLFTVIKNGRTLDLAYISRIPSPFRVAPTVVLTVAPLQVRTHGPPVLAVHLLRGPPSA